MVAIGETPVERHERETHAAPAPRPWSVYDHEIAAVEDRLGLLEGGDRINRRPLELKLADLRKKRDGH